MPDTRPDPLDDVLADLLHQIEDGLNDEVMALGPSLRQRNIAKAMIRAGVTLTQPQPTQIKDDGFESCAACGVGRRVCIGAASVLGPCCSSCPHTLTQPQPDACRHCPQDGHTTAWHEAHYTVRRAAKAVMDAYTDPRDGEFAVSGSGSYGKRQFDALTNLRAALRSTPAAPKEDDRE